LFFSLKLTGADCPCRALYTDKCRTTLSSNSSLKHTNQLRHDPAKHIMHVHTSTTPLLWLNMVDQLLHKIRL